MQHQRTFIWRNLMTGNPSADKKNTPVELTTVPQMCLTSTCCRLLDGPAPAVKAAPAQFVLVIPHPGPAGM